MFSRPGKSQYTESEAAKELGVSVEALRSLIQERIAPGEESPPEPWMVTFQPSDLLLLKLLASQPEE